MPELIKTTALVLESIRWHESSKIVTLYTRSEGMIKVIARGALRKKSQFAGRLETLNVVQCVISRKESRELQVLTQADILEPFAVLKADLRRLPYGLAIAEMLKKVFEKGHKDEIFFDFLLQMLQTLSSSNRPEIVFWYFLLKFVSFLGFRPDFSRCLSCGRTNFPKGAWFVFKEGALVCPACAARVELSVHFNPDTIHFLHNLQKFNHRKIHAFPLREPANVDITNLLLRYLNFHVGHEMILESLKLLPERKPSAPQ